MKEPTSFPSRSGEVLMRLPGISSITPDVESRSSTTLVQHLAVDMGVLVSKMEESVEARVQASLKTAQDPDGAVPSVSWRRLLGRSFWQDGFRTEVLPQRHSVSRFHSSWTVTRSIPVGTVSSWFSRDMYTEASYSYTGTKGTCTDYKGVSTVGERTLMSAVARQPVSTAIEADPEASSLLDVGGDGSRWRTLS